MPSAPPDFILGTDVEYEEKKFFEMTTNYPDKATTEDDTSWTEVSPKKSKRKSPTTSPELTAAVPHHNDFEPDFMLEEMDISDEAMLGIDLARTTPLPNSQPNNAPVPESQPTTQDHDQINKSKNISIVNPYSRQSKLRNKPIRQAIFKPTDSTIANKRKPTTSPTTTSAKVIDMIEEVTTQSTDKDSLKYPTTNSTNRSTFTQRDNTPINDGTLRITIRWKPENYDELS